ncbi:MAG: energy-coupling factor transporter ATPase [Clostridia bacterium]|nr:energy-coupling factor transporter ATPase [Clostridia bacterium]
MNALEIKDLDFAYESGKNVLSGINITVEEGEFVCLLGRNGSGKSTLARLINGLLAPTGGSVSVFGMDSSDKKNLFEIRKRAGMVFQNPDNQMVASIVEDDLAFGPENVGVKREEIGERISYALAAVGMEEFRHSTPSRLSGGQKQRIAIAGVLALKPDILILDESTAMLDPKGRGEVMKVVKDLNKNGMTIVSITHYMDEAVDCDRAVVLSEGKIVMQGAPREVFSRAEELARYGLNVPKAAYIAQKLRENGLPIADDIYEGEALEKALCGLFQKG